MTVIVAMRREDGRISMAADKRVTMKRGWRLPMADRKIALVGGMLIGVCGSTAPGELLLSGKPPRRAAGVDSLDYMRTVVGPWARARVHEAGLADQDWGALVGLNGRIFELDEEAGVTEINSDVWAVGSGKGIALGALVAWMKSGHPLRGNASVTERALRMAVDIAGQFDTTCGDGCDVIHGGLRQ